MHPFLSTPECGYISFKKNDDKNRVDRVHQHPQSLHSTIAGPGSAFHTVTLGSFDLYAV